MPLHHAIHITNKPDRRDTDTHKLQSPSERRKRKPEYIRRRKRTTKNYKLMGVPRTPHRQSSQATQRSAGRPNQNH